MSKKDDSNDDFSMLNEESTKNIQESVQETLEESIQRTIQGDGQEKGAISLLRVSTILLALVSFWATAQGMKDYVFSQAWQAYAASLAVQGILLGLNFYLPTFWRKMNMGDTGRQKTGKNSILSEVQESDSKEKKRRAGGILKKLGLLSLTGVVLFCSSWFSFVYIVDQVYGVSWAVESRLLIQSTYRQELYNASDYTGAYEDVLRNALNNQILDLYSQAKEIGEAELTNNNINVTEEKTVFAREGFAARTEMNRVLDMLEAALDENAAPGTKERAMEVVVSTRGSLETTATRLAEQVEIASEDVTKANGNLQSAQARLNNAPSEVDTTSHIQSINTALAYLQSRQERLQELQRQRDDYQEALNRIQYYEISLGLASSGSGDLISASLRMIQQELFLDNPNLENLETQATSIFQQLQSASNTSENDGQNYMELLRDTNQFIDDLHKYRSLRMAGSQLDTMIEGMRTNTEVLVDDDSKWKSDWSARLDGLKSLIGSLPAYSSESYSENSDTPFLLGYNRAGSADALDEMIRLYIADHNAAQQGLIYLFDNPHPGLAWFSLILAFFLDIAAFTTGLLIDIIDSYNNRSGQVRYGVVGDGLDNQKGKIGLTEDESEEPFFNFVPVEKKEKPEDIRYIYLTGDYIHIDGQMTYCGIEKGMEIECYISGPFLDKGMYSLSKGADDGQSGSYNRIKDRKTLSFLESAQDGVYLNCQLKYEESALSILEMSDDENRDLEQQFTFLANVEPNVPVFLLGQLDETIPVEQLGVRMQTISLTEQMVSNPWISLLVVKLNEKGSKVSALYLVYD